MGNSYITEAFKKSSLLEGEDFTLDSAGLQDLDSFLGTAGVDPDEEAVDIFDLEAEAKEDLKQSYIGKLIAECGICHSDVFLGKDEVTIDEEGNWDCEDIECPYCMSTGEFTLIGEVAPFKSDIELDEPEVGEPAEDTEIEIDTDHDGDEDVEIEIKGEDDELEEGIGGAIAGAALAPKAAELVGGKVGELAAEHPIATRAIGAIAGSKIQNAFKNKNESLSESLNEQFTLEYINDAGDIYTREYFDTFDEAHAAMEDAISHFKLEDRFDLGMCISDESGDLISAEPYDDHFEIIDYREGVDEGLLGGLAGAAVGAAVGHPIIGAIAGSKIQNAFKEGTELDEEAHICGPFFIECDSEEEAERISSELFNMGWGNDYVGGEVIRIFAEGKTEDKTVADLQNDLQSLGVDLGEGFAKQAAKIGASVVAGKAANSAKKAVKAGVNAAVDSVHNDIKNALGESIEGAVIETDTETMTMETNPQGGISVETIPKNDVVEDEVIAPISDETIDEINAENAEDEFAEDELANDEIAFDDFDEESFDGLGESYLKRCYENVNGFKTSKVSAKGNKLVVEGVISFTSGNEKNTSFVFEQVEQKNNKIRLEGFNTNISKGKKAFKLTCRNINNNLVCESLNYNYRSKNELNESIRVYGTVRKVK